MYFLLAIFTLSFSLILKSAKLCFATNSCAASFTTAFLMNLEISSFWSFLLLPPPPKDFLLLPPPVGLPLLLDLSLPLDLP